jgi:hypothetical protein
LRGRLSGRRGRDAARGDRAARRVSFRARHHRGGPHAARHRRRRDAQSSSTITRARCSSRSGPSCSVRRHLLVEEKKRVCI